MTRSSVMSYIATLARSSRVSFSLGLNSIVAMSSISNDSFVGSELIVLDVSF